MLSSFVVASSQAPPMSWPDGLQPLQMCSKLIAGNVSFPESSSKISWVGSQWAQQKLADQPGQAWHIHPPWNQAGRKARSVLPNVHGLSGERVVSKRITRVLLTEGEKWILGKGTHRCPLYRENSTVGEKLSHSHGFTEFQKISAERPLKSGFLQPFCDSCLPGAPRVPPCAWLMMPGPRSLRDWGEVSPWCSSSQLTALLLEDSGSQLPPRGLVYAPSQCALGSGHLPVWRSAMLTMGYKLPP